MTLSNSFAVLARAQRVIASQYRAEVSSRTLSRRSIWATALGAMPIALAISCC